MPPDTPSTTVAAGQAVADFRRARNVNSGAPDWTVPVALVALGALLAYGVLCMNRRDSGRESDGH